MTSAEFFSNFIAILPVVLLVISGVVLLVVSAWTPPERRWLAPLWAALTLVASLGLFFWLPHQSAWAFSQMVLADGFGTFLSALFLFSGLVCVGLSVNYFQCSSETRSEYYVLLLFSVAGMMLISIAADLIVFFLALELLSLPLYVMVGLACRRNVPEQTSVSDEAALKYFLMGVFASAFVLYGIALIFGASGSTSLPNIINAFQSGATNLSLLIVGAGLLLVGFSFKVAVVPFHMWLPDVYQGAPTPVTAFMSVGTKAAGFAALVRIFAAALAPIGGDFVSIIWMLAALSMLMGNLAAIPQSNLKRLLAYSSIAHAGYLLMPLVAISGQGRQVKDAIAAMLFYLLAYSFASLGTWSVVIALEREDRANVDINDLAGLGRRSPWLAACMTVFMLSLIGLPPLLGFVGKFYLFSATVAAGQVSLALVGLIASLISTAYYLRVIVMMYMRDGNPEVNTSPLLKLISAALALALLILPILATTLFTGLWRLVFGM